MVKWNEILLQHVKSYQDKWVIITVLIDGPLNSVSLVENGIYLNICHSYLCYSFSGCILK